MNNTCEKAVLYAAGELTADEKTAFVSSQHQCLEYHIDILAEFGGYALCAQVVFGI